MCATAEFSPCIAPLVLRSGSDAPPAEFFLQFANALNRLDTVGDAITVAGDHDMYLEQPSTAQMPVLLASYNLTEFSQ